MTERKEKKKGLDLKHVTAKESWGLGIDPELGIRCYRTMLQVWGYWL